MGAVGATAAGGGTEGMAGGIGRIDSFISEEGEKRFCYFMICCGKKERTFWGGIQCGCLYVLKLEKIKRNLFCFRGCGRRWWDGFVSSMRMGVVSLTVVFDFGQVACPSALILEMWRVRRLFAFLGSSHTVFGWTSEEP